MSRWRTSFCASSSIPATARASSPSLSAAAPPGCPSHRMPARLPDGPLLQPHRARPIHLDGVTYQLENAANHAIHGDVRFRKWEIREASATHLCCAISSAAFPDPNWPWPYEARVGIAYRGTSWPRASDSGTAARPMPTGFGWHPFYRRGLTRDGEAVRLQMRCRPPIPMRTAIASRLGLGTVSTAQDFSPEKPLFPIISWMPASRGMMGTGTSRGLKVGSS